MKKIKNTRKIVIVILSIILTIFIILEIINIGADIYNFRKLTEIKEVLTQYSKENYNFKSISEFNIQYNKNIQPLNNCYYVSKSISSGKGYLLGFKYNSFLFSLFSYEKFYSYPKYNMSYWQICDGSSCYDANRKKFERVISNPCK